MKELLDFCNTHKIIYIYGDGPIQLRLAEYLKNCGVKIKGIVVSDSFAKGGTVCISELKEYFDVKNTGIVVALSDKHFSNVAQSILKNGYDWDNIFFVSQKLKSQILQKKETKSECVYGEPPTIDTYINYYKYVTSKSKKNQLNVFCCQHLGDALTLLGLKKELERRYERPVHYLLLEKQECLAKLYEIDNYSLIHFEGFIDFNKTKGFPKWRIGGYESDIFDFMFPHIPQTDVPFVWGRLSWNYLAKEPWRNMIQCRAYMFGLEMEKIDPPRVMLEPSEELDAVIDQLGGYDKIVLFAPAALSRDGVETSFWLELGEKKISEVYSIIVNAAHEEKRFDQFCYLDLSVSDLIALGQRAHEVHSSRSGICDCLSNIGKRLYVYYRTDMDRGTNYWSINDSFNIEEEVNEIIVRD